MRDWRIGARNILRKLNVFLLFSSFSAYFLPISWLFLVTKILLWVVFGTDK